MAKEIERFKLNMFGCNLPEREYPGVISKEFRWNSGTQNYDCTEEIIEIVQIEVYATLPKILQDKEPVLTVNV